MKILVSEMPDKKEECLFYKTIPESRGRIAEKYKGYCILSNNKCSFKNESIFGAECRCLKVGLSM